MKKIEDKTRNANKAIKYYLETLIAECKEARDEVEKQACNCIIAKLKDIKKRGVREDGERIRNYIDTLKVKMQASLSSSDYQIYKGARQKLKQIVKQLIKG